MTDIVERLQRKVFRGPTMEAVHTKTLEWEAADEIARLRAQNAGVVAALRWFVDEYERVQPLRQARVHALDCRCVLCAYDNARAALAKLEEK